MINAAIELLQSFTPTYNTDTRILKGSRIRIKERFNGMTEPPSIGDILIDSSNASIWRIIVTSEKTSDSGAEYYNLPELYLLNANNFNSDILTGDDVASLYSDSKSSALVTPIDNKLSATWDPSSVSPNIVRIISQYNAAQGGVKVINYNTSDKTIKLENKIILDLSDARFLKSTSATPSLELNLPDYTHFNAGHTIEFFDAAAQFDSKNVNISPATGQKINTATNPILLDITYSTIRFIYSGDANIGWVF